MIYLVLTRGGRPMRYFPVGAKGAIHVPLAVVEDIVARKQGGNSGGRAGRFEIDRAARYRIHGD